MRHIRKRLGYPVLATLALVAARPVHADAVTDWNAIMQATVAPANPFAQARSAAIVQLAVFEAVNAIDGDYEPYLGTIAARHGASPDAAAIAAAHRTLVTLFPASAATLDTLRAQSLSALPDGAAKNHGVAVGEAAAAAMLRLRANDGSAEAASVPYTPGTVPGAWQPTPPAFAPAFLPGWGSVTPFGLRHGSQFRVPPPPELNTHRYAIDYNEVKRVGKVDSPFRPQDRTDVAKFYAATTPVLTWNPAARQVSAAHGKTLSENARIFALLAMAIADGSIAVFESKYFYSYWRPVTAIWNGGLDDNDLTDPDLGWLPLITTPAFPSYPSAHASLSGGARAVLERAFGHRGLAITLSNSAVPGVVLNYTAWEQITDDIDDARVYGGIHFRYDQEAGALQGRHVGKFILRHYLRSANDGDEDE
jgi:PAP2 superfamily